VRYVGYRTSGVNPMVSIEATAHLHARALAAAMAH
jgi:hypothetical protein